MQERTIIHVGERVALGEMLMEDQQRFWEWHQNPELLRLIVDHDAPTPEDQYAWFVKTKESDRKMFSLITVPDATLIGHGGFVDIDLHAGSAQFRITIGHTEYWGKGYGTEATQCLLRHGFETMTLERIWLRVLSSNIRAVRMYEKLGFQPVQGDSLFQEQEEVGVMRMELLRGMFR